MRTMKAFSRKIYSANTEKNFLIYERSETWTHNGKKRHFAGEETEGIREKGTGFCCPARA